MSYAETVDAGNGVSGKRLISEMGGIPIENPGVAAAMPSTNQLGMAQF